MADVAFLGLGVMGFPMAGHLAEKGHVTTVWNRSPEKTEAWLDAHSKHGGKAAESIGEAVSDKDFVFMCVGDDPDVQNVGAKAIAGMKAGAILTDHTTASASMARGVNAAAVSRKVGFIDAPVSGGQAGAENGQLTIMCGADDDHFKAAEPIMSSYAKSITHMGMVGAGQLTKMVNQLCIAGVLQGLAEGVHFAKRAGLDIDLVLKAIGGGAAQSWQMDNRAKTMAADEFEFGFAVDWMRKDLRIALDAARDNGARLPVAALVDQFYAEVQAMGGGRWDTSSLVKRLESADAGSS